MTTIDTTYSYPIRTAATGDDHAVDLLDFTVGLHFTETAADDVAAADQAGHFRAWLDEHVDGRDLTYVFHFPPLPRLLAAYLLDVATVVAPAVTAVSISTDRLTVTARPDEPVG